MSDPTTVAAVEAPAAVIDASTTETLADTKTNGEANENKEANGEPAATADDANANGDAKEDGAPTGKKGRAKKDKSAAPAAEPSRRSTRISSQPSKPKEEESGRKRSVSGAKKNGKRGAEEVDADVEEGSHKKAKADEEGLKVGDMLPSLTVKNEKGEDVQVATLAAEKGVVLFCVPKADTPGCTAQACGYRDIYAEFTAINYDIYCVSADSSEAQAKWQNKKTLPYALLSDPSRELIGALGAGEKNNTKTKRSHFVFEKGGILVDRKVPVKAGDSPKIALDFIKNRSGGGGEDVVMADDTAPAETATETQAEDAPAVPEVAPGAPPAEAAAPVESAPVGAGVSA